MGGIFVHNDAAYTQNHRILPYLCMLLIEFQRVREDKLNVVREIQGGFVLLPFQAFLVGHEVYAMFTRVYARTKMFSKHCGRLMTL